VFGKRGCIFRSLCFSKPVLFSELFELLNCFASELSLASEPSWAYELFELLNCFASELSLASEPSWASELFELLNCFASELFCFWTELCFWIESCFWTELLLLSSTLFSYTWLFFENKKLFFENGLYLEKLHFETNLVENIHWIILFGNSFMNSFYDFMNCWWLCMLRT